MEKRQRRGRAWRLLAILVATATVTMVTQAPASAGSLKETASLRTFVDGSEIPGDVDLLRTKNGLKASIDHPGAPAGHMYTAWFIVFDNPEDCWEDPFGPIKCGEADIFGNAAVHVTVTRVTGNVTGANGFKGSGHASVGKAPVGAERIQWIFDMYGNTNDPMVSTDGEVHIVLEDHGPLDPALMPDEIQLAGAEPVAFAVFAAP